MENLILLLTASLVFYKSSRKFKRSTIGDINCSVLFFPDPKFDYTGTEDGDSLYFTEHSEKFVTYGILCAKLAEPIQLDDAREVLTNYMNRLHKPFNALYSTGITNCPEGNQPPGTI